MQTFVPYPSFARSAEVLDDRRLGKQRVETLQILRALVWPTYGWKRHPAVLMWQGFTPALVAYGVAMCDEWRRRGHRDGMRVAMLEYTGGREVSWSWCLKEGLLPPWIGNEALHLSHRSKLVGKDPDHYRHVFPGVPDDLEYVWPGSVFPVDLPETPGLVAWWLDQPALPDEVVDPVPLDHRPGPSIAKAPTEADLAAIRAEAEDVRKIRFFRRGQSLPPPTSRFTLQVNALEKISRPVSIQAPPRSSP